MEYSKRDLKNIRELDRLGRDPGKGLRKMKRNKWLLLASGFVMLFLSTLFFGQVHDLLKLFVLPLAGALMGVSAVQSEAIRNMPAVMTVIDWAKVREIAETEGR